MKTCVELMKGIYETTYIDLNRNSVLEFIEGDKHCVDL